MVIVPVLVLAKKQRLEPDTAVKVFPSPSMVKVRGVEFKTASVLRGCKSWL